MFIKYKCQTEAVPATMKKLIEKYQDHLYFVFRLFVGFLFFTIGAQRLLGWFGGEQTAALFSLFGLAGLIELLGGLAILLGLFTRPAALISAIYMIIEYLRSHAPFGPVPIMNGGEVEFLLFAAFLVLLAFGARRWSLEKFLFKKEI